MQLFPEKDKKTILNQHLLYIIHLPLTPRVLLEICNKLNFVNFMLFNREFSLLYQKGSNSLQ